MEVYTVLVIGIVGSPLAVLARLFGFLVLLLFRRRRRSFVGCGVVVGGFALLLGVRKVFVANTGRRCMLLIIDFVKVPIGRTYANTFFRSPLIMANSSGVPRHSGTRYKSTGCACLNVCRMTSVNSRPNK